MTGDNVASRFANVKGQCLLALLETVESLYFGAMVMPLGIVRADVPGG